MPMCHHTYRFFRVYMAVLLGGSLWLWTLATASLAQVTTTITADGTMGTVVTPNCDVCDITGGTRPGNGGNLFHSFGQFTVGTNHTARFVGPPGVENIVGRVTGGDLSHIDGTVQSGANLFLLNPAGVLFGPNARLNVSGSFHVSTADYLRLQDGNVFEADRQRPSTLTAAPPAAFGFQNASRAAITVQGGQLRVRGGDMSLVGGDITVDGGTVRADGGQLHLASVASDEEISLAPFGSAPEDSVITGAPRSTIRLVNGASLSTRGNGGGTIVIRSGQLILERATIAAENSGSMDSAGVGVNIDVSETLQLRDGSVITAASQRTGAGGSVTIRAGRVALTDGSSVSSESFGGGRVGDIRVRADRITIANNAAIFSSTVRSGVPAGNVRVEATTSIMITDQDGDDRQSGIFNFGDRNMAPGLVEAQTARLTMDGGTIGTPPEFEGFTAPRAGSVRVIVDQLVMQGGARIDSSTRGSEAAGTVTIRATGIVLTDGATIAASSTVGIGNAGDIDITTDRLTLSKGSSVSTSAEQATGGNISIEVQRLHLQDSSITADVQGAEDTTGGDILITAQEFVLLEDSMIQATAGQGQGGNIEIQTQAFIDDADSRLDASSDTGIDGEVDIQAVITDLSGTVTPLPQRYADVTPLLSRRCAERLRGGQVSSFVVAGRDGVPADPDGGLPSLMVDAHLGTADKADRMRPLHEKSVTVDGLQRRPKRAGQPWRQAALVHDCPKERSKTVTSQSAR